LLTVGSLGLQAWSHHSATLGHFLKTTPVPVLDGLGLLALGAIPLFVLELVKWFRSRRRPARPPAPAADRAEGKHG
jgi:hypothetical protein